MKRIFTLIVLLGVTVGVLTGCNESSSNPTSSTDTNAPPAAGTNK